MAEHRHQYVRFGFENLTSVVACKVCLRKPRRALKRSVPMDFTYDTVDDLSKARRALVAKETR